MPGLLIDELLYAQAIDQAVRYSSEIRELPPRERMEFIRTQTLGAIAELMEVLGECGWKTWRKQGFGEVNRERYIQELADVLIFVSNLAAAVSCSGAEMGSAIRAVQSKNRERFEGDY